MKFLHLIFLCQFSLNIFTQTDVSEYHNQLVESKKTLLKCSDSLFSTAIVRELDEHIFPYWYGTPWDFNGYTNTPRKGVIACGYFVSTTLKHVGFNLNRYDIAKMYSSDIVKVLCHGDFETLYDYEKFKSKTFELEKGLYILGLSNHVGFLSIEEDGAYFIHSDYTSELGVRKESVTNSIALQNSSSFWIGNFSNHPETVTCFKNATVYLRLKD